MVFVQLHFRLISSQLSLSFIGRVFHPDFKNLSSRQQSNCLNIAINMTVDFNQLCKSKEVLGLTNYIESTISLFDP